MTEVVYLDHHATTPCDPRVVEAMIPWFGEHFGNAASVQHPTGQEAHRAVERARQQVAALVGASPREIVFTSGATESLNLALKGLVEAAPIGRDHLVVSAIEHKAVLDTCAALERRGATVTILPVDEGGFVDPEAVRDAVDARTVAVAVMAANNEIGTVQPLDAVAAVCRETGAHLLTDAAQAAGKIPLDVRATDLDLAALSAHKMYGPKGVGALFVRSRPRVRLAPQMHGGGHERGLRSGTLNVPGLVGFGEACDLARKRMGDDAERMARLRDRMLDRLREALPGVHLNGALTGRLPHNLNVAFEGVEGDALVRSLPDVALSSGSACTTATVEPSYVLKALGLPDWRVHASARIGLGRGNTAEDVERATERIIEAVRRHRAERGWSPG
ncbi:MAG: cysteine desulfurase family protein [Myxococcota bacterium]